MKPGRELDVLVAKRVMGLVKATEADAPHFSTDLSAAEQAAARLKLFTRKRPSLTLAQQPHSTKWNVLELTKYDINYISTGETAPHAICLAALKAVGVEV